MMEPSERSAIHLVAPEGALSDDLDSLFGALGWTAEDRIPLLGGPSAASELCYGIEGTPYLLVRRMEFCPDTAFELRRRAWSLRLSVSIFVDGSYLRILENGRRPSRSNPIDASCLLVFPLANLSDRWSQVQGLLSRRAVAAGSLEEMLARSSKRGRPAVDALLADMADLEPGPALEPLLYHALVRRFFEERGVDPRVLEPVPSASAWNAQMLAATERALAGPDCPYDFTVLPTEVLGELHERFLDSRPAPDAVAEPARPRAGGALDRRRRKSSGIFYTPDAVVRYVVKRTVGASLLGQTIEQAAHLSVLDPACGCGTFLVHAFREMVEWYRRRCLALGADPASGSPGALVRDRGGRWQVTAEMRAVILENSIFGIDLDARAVELTRVLLALAALEGDPGAERAGADSVDRLMTALDANICVGDSIMTSDHDFQRNFPRAFDDGGFDVVLGNPPYLSYGGRQSVGLGATEREYLARMYESSGWASAHALFVERSAKSWSKRFVSFIVPDQVGHLEGYRSLRALLARQGGLCEVKYWGERVFKAVVTPSLTFVFDKTMPATPTQVVNVDGSAGTARFEQGQPWTISRAGDLMDKLRAKGRSIRAYLADCGIRTTQAKKQVVKLSEAQGDFLAVLEGKQVTRYHCDPPAVAVMLDSGAPLFRSNESKYTRAKFLIRQTAAYPVVGPREHATYFRNSLHALYDPDDDTDVRYVVGLLNSKLLRFAYAATVRESQQRVFPQVKLAALGALPIRMVDRTREGERQDRIIELVDAILAAERSAVIGDDRRARIEKLDAQIDHEVFALYGLTDSEIAEVTSALGPAVRGQT